MKRKKKVMNSINDYITSSRFIKGEPYLEHIYKRLYEEITKNDSDLPILKFCYSTEKTCEFETINNDEYIIYDNYIGSSLNTFNKIYYGCENIVDSIVYAVKCFAEIYHYSGDKKMAILCAKGYEIYREKMEIFSTSNFSLDRNFAILYQEKFILLHEIYHWKFSHFSSQEKCELINNKRVEILSYWLSESSPGESCEADVIINNLMRLFPGYVLPNNKYKKNAKFLRNRIKKRRNIELRLELEIIINEDDFIEEILCDEYALNQLLGVEENTLEIIKYVYLGIQNLEIMTFMRSYVNNPKSEDCPRLLLSSSLRREFFIRCTAQKNVKETDKNQLNKDFSEINERFSTKIYYPIVFFVPEILRKWVKVKVNKNEMEDIDEVICCL